MGTRHLTAVVLNKKIKVAQYGQWDGYPEGQGAVVMSFIKKFLNKKLAKGTGLDKFKKAVGACTFLTAGQIKHKWTECGADPNSDMVNMAVSNKHKERYPQLSRDTGADILEMIYKSNGLGLDDASSFAADSLFCEYAYVLDLDNEVLEVYKGFNEKPAKGRFSKMEKAVPEHYKAQGKEYKYEPVTLFKKIDFKDCGAAAVKQLVKDVEAFYEREEKAKKAAEAGA